MDQPDDPGDGEAERDPPGEGKDEASHRGRHVETPADQGGHRHRVHGQSRRVVEEALPFDHGTQPFGQTHSPSDGQRRDGVHGSQRGAESAGGRERQAGHNHYQQVTREEGGRHDQQDGQ